MKKNLEKWLQEGRLVRHKPSYDEIKALQNIVKRDIADSDLKQLSVDRRYATLYNAALQLATIALYVSGWRVKPGAAHHWITFSSLSGILGENGAVHGDYFNLCRSKRNETDYDLAGAISEAEFHELVNEVKAFRITVDALVKAHSL